MQEFSNRLYDLRKKSGQSQERLAEQLNVSRQTLSKWELGESTPDMEKLILISDLFEISLDELILGKKTEIQKTEKSLTSVLEENVFTVNNRRKTKTLGKIILIIFAVILAIDVISMVLYFVLS